MPRNDRLVKSLKVETLDRTHRIIAAEKKKLKCKTGMTSYPSQVQQNSAASVNSAGIVKIKYLRIINQFNYNLPRLESVGFQKTLS